MIKENRITFLNTLSYIVLIIVFGFMMLMFYWLLAPITIATIEEPIPILNENNEIAIGDTILMQLEIEKFSDAKVDASVYITCDDGNLVTMASPNSGTTLPKGQYSFTSDSYVLPPKVAVGAVCTFHYLNIYEPNPVRTIQSEWVSEPFTVIGG